MSGRRLMMRSRRGRRRRMTWLISVAGASAHRHPLPHHSHQSRVQSGRPMSLRWLEKAQTIGMTENLSSQSQVLFLEDMKLLLRGRAWNFSLGGACMHVS